LENKVKKFIFSAVIVCASFASEATQSDSNDILKQVQDDKTQQCIYFPNECSASTLGAGNGGGNEPPLIKKRKVK
jgi:hypothetical protein